MLGMEELSLSGLCVCLRGTRLEKKLGSKSQGALNFSLQTIAHTLIAMVTYTSFEQKRDTTMPVFYEDGVQVRDSLQ